MRALTDASFFVLPATEFGAKVREWFPMAMHLLEGLFIGMRTSQAIVGQRERLLGLGRLTAGLTHELNNPAAAAVRATSSLRERVAMMRHKLANLADGRLNADDLIQLAACKRRRWSCWPRRRTRTPMQASDDEDAVIEWLDDHGVRSGWELAETLSAAGIGTTWLERVAAEVPETHLEGGLRWITYTLDTERLMREIEDATHRISSLVGAAKQYSQLDRAAHQDIDVPGRPGQHAGHDVPASSRAAGSPSSRTTPRTSRTCPAYPAELNQVWTNLIDNALGAMAGPGHADAAHEAGRRVRPGRGRRHRARHPGENLADLRAVLHDQAGRRGHRSRPGHLLPDRRPAPPRRSAGRLPARRHAFPGLPAADRAARRPDLTSGGEGHSALEAAQRLIPASTACPSIAANSSAVKSSRSRAATFASS